MEDRPVQQFSSGDLTEIAEVDRAQDPHDELDILLLAYYFPPIGGAGVQRSLKFVRYLPENGCRLTVVTGPGSPSGRWTPLDETLNAEIPEATRIIRLSPDEPAPPAIWGERAHRWLGTNSIWSRWWIEGATRAAEGLNPDVIIASASPYGSIDVAAELGRMLGKPWIADLRDPWALDEMIVYPSGLHRRHELKRMRRLLSCSDAIVMSTPEAVWQLLEAFPELAARPVVSIPNGYDAADFAAVDVQSPDTTMFRIVHTGYLHADAGLQERRRSVLRRLVGGATPGVDILTRSHYFLLAAVDRLLASDPGLRDRLEVHLAGVISDVAADLASKSPVTIVHGYVSHADSVALIRSADLLFLPMQNLPEGRRSSTVPGKTYEYLASGRPILGAVPAGDARDLLECVGHAVCAPDDVAGIAENIAREIARHDDNHPPPKVDWEVVRRFERRRVATQLSELIRSVTRSAAREPVEQEVRVRRAS